MNLDYFLSIPAGPDSETINFKLKYHFDYDRHITPGQTTTTTICRPTKEQIPSPDKIVQNYTNNTFSLTLNMIFKNYFSNIF